MSGDSTILRHERFMIRALHDLGASKGYPVSLHLLARHMSISEAEAHVALAALREERIARKRTRKGEECWEPW